MSSAKVRHFFQSSANFSRIMTTSTRLSAIISIFMILFAIQSLAWERVSTRLDIANNADPNKAVVTRRWWSMPAQRFRIFAYDGEDYSVYSGNFTDSFDSNSIWNSFGTYGNEFSSESIWNEFSEYGNEYNSYSSWNEYSSYPPIIVDDEWNVVDYFSCSYMPHGLTFNV